MNKKVLNNHLASAYFIVSSGQLRIYDCYMMPSLLKENTITHNTNTIMWYRKKQNSDTNIILYIVAQQRARPSLMWLCNWDWAELILLDCIVPCDMYTLHYSTKKIKHLNQMWNDRNDTGETPDASVYDEG